jgi:flagellar biosynthesis chaperone FliJ
VADEKKTFDSVAEEAEASYNKIKEIEDRDQGYISAAFERAFATATAPSRMAYEAYTYDPQEEIVKRAEAFAEVVDAGNTPPGVWQTWEEDEKEKYKAAKEGFDKIAEQLEQIAAAGSTTGKTLPPGTSPELVALRDRMKSTAAAGDIVRAAADAAQLALNLGDQEKASRIIRFARQCFMLYNMDVFATQHIDALQAKKDQPVGRRAARSNTPAIKK